MQFKMNTCQQNLRVAILLDCPQYIRPVFNGQRRRSGSACLGQGIIFAVRAAYRHRAAIDACLLAGLAAGDLYGHGCFQTVIALRRSSFRQCIVFIFTEESRCNISVGIGCKCSDQGVTALLCECKYCPRQRFTVPILFFQNNARPVVGYRVHADIGFGRHRTLSVMHRIGKVIFCCFTLLRAFESQCFPLSDPLQIQCIRIGNYTILIHYRISVLDLHLADHVVVKRNTGNRKCQPVPVQR